MTTKGISPAGRSGSSTLSPADAVLADFRESAGLLPPPRTLCPAASRLIDLLDKFCFQLGLGWDIPRDFPADRFIPTVSPNRDLVVPILQYVADLGFTGDAHRLSEAMERFYAYRDPAFSLSSIPGPDDDKGWKEYQQRCVLPLKYHARCLSALIVEVRQVIIDAGTVEGEPAARPLDAEGGGENRNKQQEELTGEAKALALLVQHPEWTDTAIAEAVPCSRTTLYDWPKYMAAREALRQGRGQKPRGTRDADGNLEAWR